MAIVMSGRDALRRLFEVIAVEADRNPRLMEKLLAAFPKELIVQIEKPVKVPIKEDKLASINPIAIVEERSGSALLDILSTCEKKEALVAMVKRYRLDVPARVLNKRATIAVMRKDIVDAAVRKTADARRAGG